MERKLVAKVWAYAAGCARPIRSRAEEAAARLDDPIVDSRSISTVSVAARQSVLIIKVVRTSCLGRTAKLARRFRSRSGLEIGLILDRAGGAQ